MKINIALSLVSGIFICLGLLSLKVALQKVSYMDEQRKKGIEPIKNFGRLFFVLFAVVTIYAGIRLLLFIN